MKIKNSVKLCFWNSVKIRTLFQTWYISMLAGLEGWKVDVLCYILFLQMISRTDVC